RRPSQRPSVAATSASWTTTRCRTFSQTLICATPSPTQVRAAQISQKSKSLAHITTAAIPTSGIAAVVFGQFRLVFVLSVGSRHRAVSDYQTLKGGVTGNIRL